MRRILGVWLVLLVCWQSAVLAAERRPVRVVQMPLVVERAFQMPSARTVRVLDSKVSYALHAPLSGVLGSVEYVSDSETEQAEEKLKEDSSYRTASYEQQIERLAQSLDADFVVLPSITAYEQYTYMSWQWNRGTMLHSYVAMNLYIYDRTTDKVTKKSASRSYHEEFSASGTAETLVQECMDSLLERTKLHEKFWSQVKSRDQLYNESAEEGE